MTALADTMKNCSCYYLIQLYILEGQIRLQIPHSPISICINFGQDILITSMIFFDTLYTENKMRLRIPHCQIRIGSNIQIWPLKNV